jgi:tetratricopeptide (TPR) repeat protein
MKLLLLALIIFPDIVYLKNGGKLEGNVVPKGDSYVIETDFGSITVKKADVERVEKKEWKPKGGPKMPEKGRASLPESYSHPFYSFKIYLPQGWNRGPNHGRMHCSFYGPKDIAYIPRIDLLIERNTAELGAYVAKFKEAYAGMYKDITFPFEEATTIQGNTAYQFSAVFRDGEIPWQVLWTFVANGDRKFVLSYACTLAWFDKYYAPVNGAMRTLRIYREPAATKEQKEEFQKLYNAGQDHYKKNEYAKALDLFRKAAAIIPDYPEIHTLIGGACLRLKQLKNADDAYRKAIALDPHDAGNHHNLGICLLQQDEYSQAIETLSKAVELAPDLEPALTNLAAAYLGTDRPARAKEILEKSLELNPTSVPGHYNLGLAYERLNEPKSAEREYKEVLKLEPNHAGAKEALARLRK